MDKWPFLKIFKLYYSIAIGHACFFVFHWHIQVFGTVSFLNFFGSGTSILIPTDCHVVWILKTFFQPELPCVRATCRPTAQIGHVLRGEDCPPISITMCRWIIHVAHSPHTIKKMYGMNHSQFSICGHIFFSTLFDYRHRFTVTILIDAWNWEKEKKIIHIIFEISFLTFICEI